MDPERTLKKLKKSSKKLKTQAKKSKSRHFLKRCLPAFANASKKEAWTLLSVKNIQSKKIHSLHLAIPFRAKFGKRATSKNTLEN